MHVLALLVFVLMFRLADDFVHWMLLQVLGLLFYYMFLCVCCRKHIDLVFGFLNGASHMVRGDGGIHVSH